MATPEPLAVTVSRIVDARAETLYDLISDVASMPAFSPETVSVTWCSGDSTVAPGARFKGKNAVGKMTWSTKPTVRVAERGIEFAFETPGKSGSLWRYQFEHVAEGTKITESMRQKGPTPVIVRWLLRQSGVTDRAEHLRNGMIVTLDRLAEAALAYESNHIQLDTHTMSATAKES